MVTNLQMHGSRAFFHTDVAIIFQRSTIRAENKLGCAKAGASFGVCLWNNEARSRHYFFDGCFGDISARPRVDPSECFSGSSSVPSTAWSWSRLQTIVHHPRCERGWSGDSREIQRRHPTSFYRFQWERVAGDWFWRKLSFKKYEISEFYFRCSVFHGNQR